MFTVQHAHDKMGTARGRGMGNKFRKGKRGGGEKGKRQMLPQGEEKGELFIWRRKVEEEQVSHANVWHSHQGGRK